MSTEKPDTASALDPKYPKLASSQTAAKRTDQLTVGQMEREVSQKIQALYKRVLGHQLGRVTCQLFDSRVAIVLEDSISQPVKLLLEESQTELAQRIRSDLSDVMRPRIQALLVDVLGVDVLNVLSDATLSTSRTDIIGVLACLPAVRNPEAILKAKKFA